MQQAADDIRPVLPFCPVPAEMFLFSPSQQPQLPSMPLDISRLRSSTAQQLGDISLPSFEEWGRWVSREGPGRQMQVCTCLPHSICVITLCVRLAAQPHPTPQGLPQVTGLPVLLLLLQVCPGPG
jgi:hypothetical protein